MEWKFERLSAPGGCAIEGLAWDGQALFFSQPEKDLIFRIDPDHGETTVARKYTGKVSGLAYSAGGDFYGCQQAGRRIIRMSSDGPAWAMTYRYEGVPYHDSFHNTPKHMVVDSLDRIWFSDPLNQSLAHGPALPFSSHQSILQLELQPSKDRKLKRRTYDTDCPSGVAVSLDANTLYVANRSELVSEIRAYPICKDGTLGGYRALFTLGNEQQDSSVVIDGLCVDCEGNIIACTRSLGGAASAVYIVSPSGQILGSHSVPGSGATNCAFGGQDLDRLFISTQKGELFQIRNSGHKGNRVTRKQ